jgi:hypothetical protein
MEGFAETLLATSAFRRSEQRTDVAGYVSAKAYRGDPTLQPLSAQ